MKMTLKELAGRIGADLLGDGAVEVEACTGLDDAGPHDLSFVANRKYISKLQSTRAAAVVVGPDDVPAAGKRQVLVADDPYFAFRQAVVELHGFRPQPAVGVSEQAIVDPSAEVAPDCCVQATAFIAAGAKIGERTVIYPHCYIGENVVIGSDCIVYPNVTIYDGCKLGDRVTLHAGTVVGQDGFGYATHDGEHHKIPQIGHVVIEDDVELGANCAVDRATVGATRIGRGTKMSNQVTIGHGSQIGKHNIVVALVGVAGSVTTGEYVVMGGQVGIAPHLQIGDRVQMAAKTGVMADIPAGKQVGGVPAVGLNTAKRLHLGQVRLPKLIQQVKALQKQVAKLEQQLNGPSGRDA